MDFFEKFGDKILYYQSHRSGFDPELTVEELAKAIEGRILERIAIDRSACKHEDHLGRLYATRHLRLEYVNKHVFPYTYCPLCGDKLE